METVQYKLGGVTVDIQVPSTLAEAVEIAGDEKVLNAYVDHIIYHPIATAARNKAAATLEVAYKDTPRLTETNEKGKEVVTENPGDYFNRLRRDANVDDSIMTEHMQAAVNHADLAFARVAKAERAPSTAKPGKSFYEIVARAANKPGGLEGFAANLSTQLGETVSAGDTDALARGVQRVMAKINAEAAARKKAAEASLLS